MQDFSKPLTDSNRRPLLTIEVRTREAGRARVAPARYYLLPISDRDPLEWILSESRTAFPAYRRTDASKLDPGDALLLYTTRGCFRNPTRDRGRVIGMATVIRRAEDLNEPVRFGDREFSVGIELRIESLLERGKGVELAPLVPKLRESFPNERAWSARLRRALVPMAARDANTLETELAGARPGRVEDAIRTYSHGTGGARKSPL